QELLTGHLAEGEHRQIGEEEPARYTELRPGGDEAARLVIARPFHGHQHRAAPFATDADALDETEDREQHGAPDSDLLIRRNQRHGEGGKPHQQKRSYQRGLAADAIAVMSENR